MPKAKQQKKISKKDCQLLIRLNREERDAFVQLCDEQDTSAAREIRKFIRSYLAKNSKKKN